MNDQIEQLMSKLEVSRDAVTPTPYLENAVWESISCPGYRAKCTGAYHVAGHGYVMFMEKLAKASGLSVGTISGARSGRPILYKNGMLILETLKVRHFAYASKAGLNKLTTRYTWNT